MGKSSPHPCKQWICSQIGAREHYALPRALHARGLLHRFYTDVWAPWYGRKFQRPAILRAFSGRFHADLPERLVKSFNWFFLARQCFSLLSQYPSQREEQFAEYVRVGRAFAAQVVRELRRALPREMEGLGFLGYNTGCLETLEYLTDRGWPTMVDQIDTGRLNEQIIQNECDKWPGWQAKPGQVPESYYQRLEQEWQLATKVLVNSEWSKNALLAQGVPEEKLVVVPLTYELPAAETPPPQRTQERTGSRSLTVLWLGQVILLKGIQYLFEAARRLSTSGIRFLVAGPVGISAQAVASAPANVTMVGRITRDQIEEYYRQGDLFVLPTLSDGFALTQLEAMAHGLPVITTPHCGRVVTDGVDGRIVPAGDAAALAQAIGELAADRATLQEMSRAALVKVKEFSLHHLADRLQDVLHNMSEI